MSDNVKETEQEVVTEEEVLEETSEEDIDIQVQYNNLQEKYKVLEDKVLRNSAEVENFKRRSNQELQNFMKFANQSLVEELIPIMDNIDRALDSLSEEVDESIVSGISMIYNQLQSVLTNHGVETIETVGQQFDPNYHQAVMTGKDDNFESGAVIEQFQKGYTLKGKVVRAAMVKVND